VGSLYVEGSLGVITLKYSQEDIECLASFEEDTAWVIICLMTAYLEGEYDDKGEGHDSFVRGKEDDDKIPNIYIFTYKDHIKLIISSTVTMELKLQKKIIPDFISFIKGAVPYCIADRMTNSVYSALRAPFFEDNGGPTSEMLCSMSEDMAQKTCGLIWPK